MLSTIKTHYMKTIAIATIAALAIFTSCRKKPSNESVNSSRTIRYEVTGNFKGTLFASYTTATGGTTNDPVSSLPWSKEIIYNNSVTAAAIAFSGNGGTAGQQVIIVVKRGGSQLSSTPVTADNSGSFTKAAPVIIF